MATEESCGPGDGTKCWSGQQGKLGGKGPMLSFKRKKKSTPPASSPTPQDKSAGMHMNMRDLGSEPGQVKLKTSNNKTALTTGQEAQGASNDRAVAEKKKILGFKRRVQ